MSQLIFQFPFKTNYFEKDFYVSSNNFEAYRLIESWPNWISRNINIFGDENIDSEKYFFGNLIEYYNSKYKKNLHYKFYNKTFNTKKLNKNSNIIFEKTRNNIFLNNKSIFHEKIIDKVSCTPAKRYVSVEVPVPNL